MPPRFLDAERIELKHPPLEVVVCQLRFPTILELAAGQPPIELQRRLVNSYPVSRPQRTALTVEVRPQAPPQPSVATLWSFEDKDLQWTVTLGPDFLSLETRRYVRFTDFVSRFLEILSVIRGIYPITLRERLGLRYTDRITREKEQNLPPDWPARIRQEVIPLRNMRGAGEPQMANLEVRFSFADQTLAIRSLYVDRGFGGATTDALVLDFDCYIERRDDLNGIETLLGQFRQVAYNAFRWAMGDLINFFEPAEGNAAS